jgi:hypothetical protein
MGRCPGVRDSKQQFNCLTSGCRFVERQVDLLRDPDSMQQYGKLPGDGHYGSSSGVACATGTLAETPSSQSRVFAVWPDDVVGTFNQQLPQVPVTGFGDTKLRVAVAGLTASRPQAEIIVDIPTSLETFLAAKRQHVRQWRKSLLISLMSKVTNAGSGPGIFTANPFHGRFRSEAGKVPVW